MAKKTKEQLIINQVIVRPANRQILDVGKWRTALRAADIGRYQQLFNLYDDILLDGVLGDAIDKRIRAVTGADLTFQYKDGTEGEEMIAFIDSIEFEQLLTEIMQALFMYISVIELTFDENGMHVYSVPRKHIRADQQSIAINENDPVGTILYADVPNIIEVRNPKDKYGLLIRACPYAIFKRGGLSDWAQMVEIFGMPKRIGKYSIYDVETRKALEEAFNSQGAAASLIVPKESEIDTDSSSTAVNSTLYKDFIDTLDEQLLITILSQTMTTKDGSSRSQSETHKEVQEELNKHDLRFVQRVLNQKILPLLAARGYPVKNGTFVFPKATEQPTVGELVQLSEILDIPAYYLQERYGIPQAADGDVLAKRNSPEQQPAQPTPNAKLSDAYAKEEANFFMRLRDFFADAPTMRSGAKHQNTIAKWIGSISNTFINLADRANYGINIDVLFKKALEDIYKQYECETPIVNKSLFEISNTAFQKAADTEFESAGAEFSTKNEAFINKFKHNAAVFAAFKSHKQTADIVAELLDENGELRSFHDFKKAVLGTRINANYNHNWLRTEYHMAVRSARSAVQFKKFWELKHLYPNLEYLESTARNKREQHLSYVGTILPIEHPWWDEHLPPVEWGCECSVRNTDKPATEVPDDGDTPVNPVFAHNPAKSAEMVNMKKHPYTKGVCPYFSTCQRRKLNSSENTQGVSLKDTIDETNPPMRPECAVCELAKKSALAKRREKLLNEIKFLYKKSVIRYVGSGKSIKIKFKRSGNEHLINDYLMLVKGFRKKDLLSLDRLIKEAEYIRSSELYKDRDDNIQRFYYFKDTKREIYYNVAEEVVKLKNGKFNLNRFLHAITNTIPKK